MKILASVSLSLLLAACADADAPEETATDAIESAPERQCATLVPLDGGIQGSTLCLEGARLTFGAFDGAPATRTASGSEITYRVQGSDFTFRLPETPNRPITLAYDGHSYELEPKFTGVGCADLEDAAGELCIAQPNAHSAFVTLVIDGQVLLDRNFAHRAESTRPQVFDCAMSILSPPDCEELYGEKRIVTFMAAGTFVELSTPTDPTFTYPVRLTVGKRKLVLRPRFVP